MTAAGVLPRVIPLANKLFPVALADKDARLAREVCDAPQRMLKALLGGG